MKYAVIIDEKFTRNIQIATTTDCIKTDGFGWKKFEGSVLVGECNGTLEMVADRVSEKLGVPREILTFIPMSGEPQKVTAEEGLRSIVNNR